MLFALACKMPGETVVASKGSVSKEALAVFVAAGSYLGPADDAVDLAALTAGARQANAEPGSLSRLAISRALAKTITFRVIASTMDFATNYFVVRDVGSALILSASGFILGPFVYYGHEKAWDYFTVPKDGAGLPAQPLLPAPR